MAKISVIVPVYNVEPYLNRCVDSILTQSFTDFELILVDDGSPDNCPAICDEYAKKDERVHVIHQENGGLSSARNAGIDWAFANSDSEWLTFIDSDDWVHTDYLKQLFETAMQAKVDIGICNFVRSKEPMELNNDLKWTAYSPEDFFVKMQVLSTIACAKLYKKELFIDLRFPLGRYHEDEFITHRALFNVEKIAFLDEPLYFYFINESSITSSRWNEKRFKDASDAYTIEYDYLLSRGFYRACNCVARAHIDLLKTICSMNAGFISNKGVRVYYKKYKKI